MAGRVIDTELQRALADAASAYRGAIVDYEAGVIDEAAFQAARFRAGIVVDLHEVWILDAKGRNWWRYDGVSLEATDRLLHEPEVDL